MSHNALEIGLRLLRDTDLAKIAAWPEYSEEFIELDYALREGGWAHEALGNPVNTVYGVEQAGELIAFTLLRSTECNSAEFRIALRADFIGRELGSAITSLTLARGFDELGLSMIHLIVRKNNLRAIRLYQRLGFIVQGECYKEVNHKVAHFIKMSISSKRQ